MMEVSKYHMYIVLTSFLLFQNPVFCEFPDKIQLKNTVSFFKTYFTSSCITLLYTEENLIKRENEIHRMMHQPTREFSNTYTTAMSFKNFLQQYSVWKAMKCNNPLLVITDTGNGTKSEIKKVAQSRLFHMTHWLIFMSDSLKIQEFFDDIRTPFDLQLIVAHIMNENFISFYEVYRVSKDRPLHTPQLGYWSKTEGYRIDHRSLNVRRNNLEGVVLKTSSIDNYPLHYFIVNPDETIEMKGFFPEIWQELERILNFSSINYSLTDKTSGIAEENGSWSGLIGMLERQEIDAAISNFIMDEQRLHIIDFTMPILRTSYQVYYRNLGNSLQWDGILRPFEKEIWYTIIIWIFLSSFFLWVFHIAAFKYKLEKNVRKEDFTIVNSGFFFIKALCNQGHYCTPGAISSRIIFFTAYLAAGVLVPSHSAALIFFLTSRYPIRPFDSLSELLYIGTYRLQTMAKSAHYTYFSNSTNPLLQSIYVKLMRKEPQRDMPYNISDALYRLCTENNLAHFGDVANMMTHVKKINSLGGNCTILHLSKHISSIYTSMGLVRESSFKSVFNYYISRILDTGIADRMEQRNLPKHVTWQNDKIWAVVEINDVSPVFIILTTGIILSLFILSIEILHAKSKNLWNKKANDVNKSANKKPPFTTKRIYYSSNTNKLINY